MGMTFSSSMLAYHEVHGVRSPTKTQACTSRRQEQVALARNCSIITVTLPGVRRITRHFTRPSRGGGLEPVVDAGSETG
jgi:hypothetical protein